MQSVQFEIRAARTREAAELSSLAFRSKRHWGYDQAFMECCRDDLTYTPGKIASAQYDFHICKYNARAVGFYALNYLQSGVAELEAMFVDPPYIGKGIGKKLMEHAKVMATAKGASRIIFQIDPHAEKFYLAMGAFSIGSRESDSIPGRQLPLFELSL